MLHSSEVTLLQLLSSDRTNSFVKLDYRRGSQRILQCNSNSERFFGGEGGRRFDNDSRLETKDLREQYNYKEIPLEEPIHSLKTYRNILSNNLGRFLVQYFLIFYSQEEGILSKKFRS